MIEKHEFPADRGYFKVHLVLEHQVLRRMDGRESCVPEDMTTAGDEGCGTRTDRYFLQTHAFSLCKDYILPQN